MKFKLLSVVLAGFVVAACGADGATGPEGKAGPAGPPGSTTTSDDATSPSTNAVTPSSGFLGRELDVQIGLTGGELNAAPKVDFGKGITVTDVKLASPTLVTAHIAIASNAESGPRDVTVGELVAKGVFKVGPSISVTELVKGQQGGLGGYLVDNLDTYVFDTAQNAFTLEAGESLLPFSVSATGAYAAEGIFLVPPLAKTGAFQLAAHNLDATGQPLVSFFGEPGSVKTAPREAEAATFGTPKNAEAFSSALGSKLYKLSSTADTTSLLVFRMHVGVGEATFLNAVLWGAGGTGKDLITIVQAADVSFFGSIPKEPPYDLDIVVPASGPSRSYFLTALDMSGASGTKFDLTPTTIAATLVPEGTDPHGTDATAQVFTLAALGSANVLTGEIKGSEHDWYKVTVADGEKVELSIDSGTSNLEAVLFEPGKLEEGQVLAVGTGGPAGRYSVQPSDSLDAGDYFVRVGKAYGETTNLTGKYTVGVRRLAP